MDAEALNLLSQARRHLTTYHERTGRDGLVDLIALDRLDDMHDDERITLSADQALRTIVEHSPQALCFDRPTDEYLHWLHSDKIHDAAETAGILTNDEDESV